MKTTHNQTSLDLKKLENILSKKLARESLDITSIIINCFLREEEINILIQHSPPMSKLSDQIFAILKNILNQQNLQQTHQFKLALAIYGEQPYTTEIFINTCHTKKNTKKQKKKTPSKNKYLNFLFSGSFLILTTIYILTRPCVIGQCTSIIKAQQLANNSQQLIKNEDLLEAENQLNIALKLLTSIPPFSSHHSTSQTLINEYQNTFNNLETILTTIKIANQAIITSQTKELSLQELTSIKNTLEQVINTLQQLTKIEEFANIAQNTQEIYQAELTIILNRYNQEIQQENSILTATEMAKIALLRQEKANSLADWQLVNTTWSLVINRLKNITENNISYQKAQQMLTEYQPKITEAQNKLNQEKIANQTYQQGLKFAQQAQTMIEQQQYSLALENWQKSLEQLLKITQNDSLFEQAQQLIVNYQKSLNNTEKQLQFSQNREKAQQDLNTICLNQERICTYSLSKDNIIKVYLDYQYLQKVLQIAMSKQAEGDLLQHISSVQKALETVSNKYKLPLEVYHSDGGLLFSYTPN